MKQIDKGLRGGHGEISGESSCVLGCNVCRNRNHQQESVEEGE